ncbi:MAG: signal recognition particle-docking protein FtsY, partial [Verrucomicrobia bacterium]|nr:signal recognition particle-docking protein FtsY [Verrucomicrobiota bacterium]
MGFFKRLKERLGKTQDKLVHEIKRIVTRSPRLTADSAEELEAALLSADFGMAMTTRIITATKKAFESSGKGDFDFIQVAADEVEKALEVGEHALLDQGDQLTVVSMVGVNGTGKTTTCAKLAHRLKGEGRPVGMAACDTFRAAAIDQ